MRYDIVKSGVIAIYDSDLVTLSSLDYQVKDSNISKNGYIDIRLNDRDTFEAITTKEGYESGVTFGLLIYDAQEGEYVVSLPKDVAQDDDTFNSIIDECDINQFRVFEMEDESEIFNVEDDLAWDDIDEGADEDYDDEEVE